MDGKLVSSYKMNGTELNINVSAFTRGIYTVTIGGKTKLFVKD